VFAEHPPAQLTLLRLGFQHGNGFAESARSGKDGAPRARFVSRRYLRSAASSGAGSDFHCSTVTSFSSPSTWPSSGVLPMTHGSLSRSRR
jgi:hypothetical protein